MVGSWSDSRELTRETWGVVKENPYMLLFPVTAAVIAGFLVLAVAAVGLGLLGLETTVADAADSGSVEDSPALIAGIVVLVLAGYLGTLVTQICMAGLVKSADEELQGRDSSFRAGISAAMEHLPALLGWAAIQALVGWLLSAIRNGGQNSGLVSQLLRFGIAGLAQVAWSVVTFFVLPAIVLQNRGPIDAIKHSFSLIRSTWGTQIAGGARLGFVVFLLGVLPGIVSTVGGVFLLISDQIAIGAPLVAIGIVVIVLAQVLISTLRAVFSVSLFHFADDGRAVGPYSSTQLQAAVRTRG